MHVTKYKPDPKVVTTKMDDQELVLLHLETRRYFTLNETGALIWDALTLGKDIVEIASAVSEQFEVDTTAAQQYVEIFVTSLEKEGLVSVENE